MNRFWKRLRPRPKPKKASGAPKHEPVHETDREPFAEDRLAEHQFDRDSRWTGTFPS